VQHRTDLQVFAIAMKLLELMAAGDDIKRLVEGITVYRNTDGRRESCGTGPPLSVGLSRS
jgi:hypothetical protein